MPARERKKNRTDPMAPARLSPIVGAIMGARSAAKIRREYESNRKAIEVIAPDKIAKRKKSKLGETLFARFSTISERCASVNEGKNLLRLRWWAGVGGSGSKNGSLVKFIFA
jgi:hypothetical protein